MADQSSIGPSLPSAALPASGSRGLQPFARLSAIAAPPQYCFLLRIELVLAKSIHQPQASLHLDCTTSCQTARVSPCRCGDDPAAEQNANGENAASGEIEPSGPSSFRQHRSSIKRQKQQNSSCVSEWELWRDNSSYNSTSDPSEHRANCSKNHLARVRIDCQLTDQDVERENCSRGNNQISADDSDDAAEGEKESVQHQAILHHSAPLAYGRLGQSCFRLSCVLLN